MSGKHIVYALLLSIGGLVLQSTLFGESRINPFGAAPNVVLVIVVICAAYLEPEPALLVAFTSGLLMDLLGGSTIGLWAIALVVVAYVTLRVRDRIDDGVVVVAAGLLSLSVLGHAIFAIASTLFGEQVFADPGWYRLIVLPSLYNLVLAAILIPIVSRIMGGRQVRRLV
jgi:rod shape-determining protein MreD